MEKFQNKYRIPSARLQSWDYRNNGAYFITINTNDKLHYFGEIIDGKMELNELGIIAEKYWAEIPTHFPFVELGNFVIMPNHTHGILIIDKPNDVKSNAVETLHCNVSTRNVSTPNVPDTNEKNKQMAKISPKPGSISTIVRSYKSVVSKNARKIHAGFGWQTRFHDHIIRDVCAFQRIQNYIRDNPLNWEKDKFNNK